MRDLRRTMLLVAGAGGLVLAAAGCTATTPAPSAGGAATGASAPESPATAVSTTATTSPAPAGTGSQPCHTPDLKVSDKGDEGGGSAGHHSEFLVFENIAGHACTLEGYPGVSFVTGNSGKQIGSAFTRTPGDSPSLRLSPGERVHATIEIANPEAVDPADCEPVTVRGYRVYPPDETAAVFVSHPETACAAEDQAVGTVKPLAARETD